MNRRLREDQERITDLEDGVEWPEGIDEKTLRRLIRLGYEFPVEPNPHWWVSLSVVLAAFLVLAIALTLQGLTLGALVLVVAAIGVLGGLGWSTVQHRKRNVIPRFIAAHTVDRGSSATLAKVRAELREVEEIGHRVNEVTDANPLLTYLDDQIDVMYVSLDVLHGASTNNTKGGMATRAFALMAMNSLSSDVHTRATVIDRTLAGGPVSISELEKSVRNALTAPIRTNREVER